ncbi:hypothetical protein, partial [Gemmatimonas sp.]|uniref:beta strand repeat-containing protein n=1 Tax=Gemmatimonas sp. TaxID=1962908 RepID=UPI0025BE534F
ITDVGVTFTNTDDLPGTSAVTPVQAAGTDATQMTDLTFASTAQVGATYTVTVNGTPYSHSAASTNIGEVLSALKTLVDAGPVTATIMGNVLRLTADAPNTAFTATGSGIPPASAGSSINVPGPDGYVLILPDNARPAAGTYSVTAESSLSVVKLPTYAGDVLTLRAGYGSNGVAVAQPASLVVVSDLQGASVTLAATASLTLGGFVTAQNLSVTAGDDLTLKTRVDNLSVSFTQPGDLTIIETKNPAVGADTGALTVSTIAMNAATGGDITIVADGDILITAITGRAGRVSITSLNGNIVIGSMAQAGAVTLTALNGTVTAGTRDTDGNALTTLDALTLDVRAKGAIDIAEKDGATVLRIDSGDDKAVTVTAGGTLTVQGAITTLTDSVSLRTTAGSIALEQAVRVGGAGTLTLDAAAAITLNEQADLRGGGGAITLIARGGALTMTGETELAAGAGTIRLQATGDITLGKLSSTSSADVVIDTSGGAVKDGGDSPADVDAPNAVLWIRAAGGVGAGTNPTIETRVAGLDIVNTGSGDIGIEDRDAVVIYRLDQQGAGNVAISTLNGAITTSAARNVDLATEADIQAVLKAGAGSVSLYAGGAGGTITLGLNADIRTATADGGAVTLTAEDGDITLAAGIRVAGDGDITLRALKGSVLNDATAVGWKAGSGAAFDPEIDWAMRRGKFVTNPATGEIKTTGIEDFNTSRIANDVVLRAAGGTYLQTTGGRLTIAARDEIGKKYMSFLFSPNALVVDAVELNVASSERQNVSVIATGNVEVKADAGGGSRGGSTGVSTFTGTQTISDAVDASGEDVSLQANDIVITDTLRSAGAILTVAPIDTSRPIVLGDSNSNPTSGALSLSLEELGYLQDGFGKIVVGGATSASDIRIGTNGGTDTVRFKDSLTIQNPLIGGELAILQPLSVDGSLTVDGSGHTTTISANTTTTADVTINDSVIVVGDRTVQSGSDGSGDLQITTALSHRLDGNGDATADTLILRSPGIVAVYGIV